MVYQEGYVYHLKANILLKQMIQTSCKIRKMAITIQLSTIYMRDEKTALLCLVPPGRHVEEFQIIYDKQIEKYGNCLTIMLLLFQHLF